MQPGPLPSELSAYCPRGPAFRIEVPTARRSPVFGSIDAPTTCDRGGVSDQDAG